MKKRRHRQKPNAEKQLLLFPEIKQVQKDRLPDVPLIPAQPCVAFCQRCGRINPGLHCPNCGQHHCPSCGGN